MIETFGLTHIALAVQDAERAFERAGGEILSRGEFCPGEPYVFCRDPDGYAVEIWHELPTAADPVRPAAPP